MPSASILTSILEPLNQEQRAVVVHKNGHAIVSAVAGSGKTLTLVHRILFLLNKGADHKRILVVMYNRDIKEIFQNRLAIACEQYGFTPPEVLTYHGLGLRIYNKLIQENKLSATVHLNGSDLRFRHLLIRALEQAGEESDEGDFASDSNEFLTEFSDLITRWKSDLLQPAEVISSIDFEYINIVFKRAYRYFEDLRLEEGFRTFSDMIYDPAIAIREDDGIGDWVGNRYDYILIDEYQDINLAQQEIIQSVAGTRAIVMAVGDEDQCIYEWRGSRPDYMSGLFEQFFNGGKRYVLSNTYRFGHTLSCVANMVMYHNKKRTKKLCLSCNDTPQTKIRIHLQPEGISNGLISNLVQQWASQGRQLSEVVILVRSWAMVIESEMELMAAGIHYVLGDKSKSYKSRPEILALIGFMALGLPNGLDSINGPDERKCILLAMFKYSDLYLRKAQRDVLAFQLSNNPKSYQIILKETAADNKLSAKIKSQLLSVSEQWKGLENCLHREQHGHEAVSQIDRVTSFNERLTKGYIQQQSANDSVRTVLALMEQAKKRKLNLLQLFEELTKHDSAENKQGGAVLITSVHKAKGGEWPMVIIPQLTDGRFPHFGEKEPDDASIEQERRLFYVAITRAVERLDLIAPEDDYLLDWLDNCRFGSPKKRGIKASRFLYETGLFRAQQIFPDLNQEISHEKITLGEKEFLYKTYLKKIQQ
ncbi:MAG: ATP-dependent helicase [Syntrophomonadaceae bacterium]|jgi:DNA helicase-2/ATP-dependent DNA helicase PcrA|nr:ATP-dependent helicase [Syntrophomonadaceae bacterium]